MEKLIKIYKGQLNKLPANYICWKPRDLIKKTSFYVESDVHRTTKYLCSGLEKPISKIIDPESFKQK